MVASSLGRRPKLIAVLNPSEVLFISSLNIGDRGDFCLDLTPPPPPPPPPPHTHTQKNPSQPLGLGGGDEQGLKWYKFFLKYQFISN
jgi:hypothetical protein